MARLPVVAGDVGTWGAVLNEYLQVGHNANGTNKSDAGSGVYNVVDYGAALNGTTNDSASIQAAIDAAWDAGGGIVVIPGKGSGTAVGGSSNAKGVVINTSLKLKSGVWLRGLGTTTALIGSADPMIEIHSNSGQDRMTISDLFLQDPDGVGIKLSTSGAYQLGWPRITVQNVTVADAVSHAFWNTGAVIECRFINCVSLRAAGYGFFVNETDNFLIGCTAAAGGTDGFNITGGNNKLAACKAYGHTGTGGRGFILAGAGRHMLVGCEAQDNFTGFYLSGQWNAISGCIADTNRDFGYYIANHNNFVEGVAMYGGGGSGFTQNVGVFFDNGVTKSVFKGTALATIPLAGDMAGNTIDVGAGPGSRYQATFATPYTPDTYLAQIHAMTLTNNLTVTAPLYKHPGQLLTLELTQDGTGGRVVTLPSNFRVNWTPDTAGGKVNTITLEWDGAAWQQIAASTGVTSYPGSGRADTFNRADGAIGTSSSGHVWAEFHSGAGSWVVATNQAKNSGSGAGVNIATLEAGVSDATVEVTVVNADVANAFVVFRYVDSSNYLRVFSNAVSKVIAGASTTLASGITFFANGDVVKIVLDGPTIKVLKNGTVMWVGADSTHITATKHGIAATGDTSTFDAFSIV